MAKTNSNYNYIVAVSINTNEPITLNAKHIVGYTEHKDNDTLTLYTTGGFTFEVYNEHDLYPYDCLSIAIDDSISHL